MEAPAEAGEGLRRPRIGICASVEQARYGLWDSKVLLVPQLYVTAVQRAGGLALLLALVEILGVEELVPVGAGLRAGVIRGLARSTQARAPYPECA